MTMNWVCRLGVQMCRGHSVLLKHARGKICQDHV